MRGGRLEGGREGYPLECGWEGYPLDAEWGVADLSGCEHFVLSDAQAHGAVLLIKQLRADSECGLSECTGFGPRGRTLLGGLAAGDGQ